MEAKSHIAPQGGFRTNDLCLRRPWELETAKSSEESCHFEGGWMVFYVSARITRVVVSGHVAGSIVGFRACVHKIHFRA